MSESPHLITRREALKRGAIAGGAVLWTVPVVQNLVMGQEFAETPSDQCIASWASEVTSFVQKKRRDGTDVLDERSNEQNARFEPGAPPEIAGEEPWFSLGFGGEIVLKFGVAYHSGKEGEVLVVETTLGSYPLEEAKVYVGKPGAWVEVPGTAKNTGSPAMQKSLDSIPGLPDIITHVRIVDITEPEAFPVDDPDHPEYRLADGFDVNAAGIGCP